MVTVSSCPTSKEKWDLAASKKHCETHAIRQNCTRPLNYVYHCVINQYRNETLEVCAKQRIILGNYFFNNSLCSLYDFIHFVVCFLKFLILLFSGHCTEFNDAGGVIQSHISAPCNQSAFPKCDQFYLSTKAYKCKST